VLSNVSGLSQEQDTVWQTLMHFVVSHWKLISVGGIVSGFGGMFKVWTWFKQRAVHSLARRVRNYADEVRRKDPNVFAFPREHLAEQLGCDSKRMAEILEVMEEKGWAVKVDFPADCWKIN
jgi:hypothetical protein